MQSIIDGVTDHIYYNELYLSQAGRMHLLGVTLKAKTGQELDPKVCLRDETAYDEINFMQLLHDTESFGFVKDLVPQGTSSDPWNRLSASDWSCAELAVFSETA